MQLYARPSWRLTRQLAADAFVLAWAGAWWWAGRAVDGAIRALTGPARETARLTTDLSRQVTDAARQAGGVPVVGDGLRQRFDEMAGSLGQITASAHEQVAALERTALLLGWVTFLTPVALLVAVWLPRRLRFVTRARVTGRVVGRPGGTELLALRALTTQPLSELRAVSPDPVAGWRAGDAEGVARLADLELASAGVRRPRGRGR